MLTLFLLFVPLSGVISLSTAMFQKLFVSDLMEIKLTALTASIINIIISSIILIFYDLSFIHFQILQDFNKVEFCDFYSGLDGISIYFVLLTTIITPIALLSNWISIDITVRAYAIIILLLETLLLAVFLFLDVFLFYVFFESILPPLFILIGLFGSDERVRASFYLFLYTLLGSLFLLLAILTMSSLMGTTDFNVLFKTLFEFYAQKFLFIGIFIAFAVKTPVIFLNLWLLKAHVESPLGGSILLAAVVLKLSLYGIFRLILSLISKASMLYTPLVFAICVFTIVYASTSTIRTIDFKEIVAYSSVAHAAVYLMGSFSNSVIGIEGAIILGLAHAFASSGLFLCVGGVLYDRLHTRLLSLYRGMTQLLPVFSISFFILCLSNMGTPITFNFVGEFMSLYGGFERLPLLGALACSSIVLSAAFTIYLYNRVAFGGSLSKHFTDSYPDLCNREYTLLLILLAFLVVLGVYPAVVLDGLHYSVSTLIYSVNYDMFQTEYL